MKYKKAKLKDIIFFNPKETIKKNQLAKKIPMDALIPFTRKVGYYEVKEFNSGTKFRNNDTLIARITPCLENGKTAYVNILDEDEIAFGSTEYFVLRADENYILPKYLYYISISDELRNTVIKSMTGTSGRQRAQKESVLDFEIELPSISIQKKVLSILDSIDSKIEVNNQIISNLEELASTLFKQWFVDFEFPDENGNPYKSSGGKMVDSELGKIPEGWEVTNLEEISIDIITGKTPNTKQKENYGEDIPFIKIPDMHNNTYIVQTETYLSKKGSDSQYKKLLPKDSICVSCIATPGLVSITSVASHTNQQINTILPKVEDLYFLYLDLKRKRNLIRELGSGGSTTLNLNKTQFGKINIINCGKREKMNFNKICEPLFSKILLLQKSNIYLAKLRDSLLPKLLSGEIELPEYEEV